MGATYRLTLGLHQHLPDELLPDLMKAQPIYSP